MKLAGRLLVADLCRSHPTWVRGLKLRLVRREAILFGVAPHVGAWIETFCRGVRVSPGVVAPHVGAWIETYLT